MKEDILKVRNSGSGSLTTGRALYLAIALGAVLTFIVLVVLKFSNTGTGKVVQVVQDRDRINREISETRQKKISDSIQGKLPDKRANMVIPGLEELRGFWATTFDDGALVTLRMDGKVFEVIYSATPTSDIRKYSKGYYTYDEKTGRLTLKPSREAGTPKETPGVKYKILTMRQFDINLSHERDRSSLYFIAPEEQIIGKRYHPLFSYADYAGAPVLKFSPISTKQAK